MIPLDGAARSAAPLDKPKPPEVGCLSGGFMRFLIPRPRKVAFYTFLLFFGPVLLQPECYQFFWIINHARWLLRFQLMTHALDVCGG
jgi:hypothetical protein